MAISLTNIARDVQRKSNYFMIYKMVSISVSPIQECIFLNLAYLESAQVCCLRDSHCNWKFDFCFMCFYALYVVPFACERYCMLTSRLSI